MRFLPLVRRGGCRGLDLQVGGARTCSPATRATCLGFLPLCPQGRHLAFPFISLLPCQASSGILSQAYVMSSRRTCPGYVLSSRRTSQGYVR